MGKRKILNDAAILLLIVLSLWACGMIIMFLPLRAM